MGIHNPAYFGRRQLNVRNLGTGDLHLVADLPHLHRHVHFPTITSQQAHAVHHGGRESVRRDGNVVSSRNQIRSAVQTVGIRGRAAPQARRSVFDGHRSVRDHRPTRVGHRANDRAARLLCGTLRQRYEQQQQCGGKDSWDHAFLALRVIHSH